MARLRVRSIILQSSAGVGSVILLLKADLQPFSSSKSISCQQWLYEEAASGSAVLLWMSDVFWKILSGFKIFVSQYKFVQKFPLSNSTLQAYPAHARSDKMVPYGRRGCGARKSQARGDREQNLDFRSWYKPSQWLPKSCWAAKVTNIALKVYPLVVWTTEVVSRSDSWMCLTLSLASARRKIGTYVLPLAVESRLDSTGDRASKPRALSGIPGNDNLPCGRATPSTRNPCRVIEGNLITLLASSIGDLFDIGGEWTGEPDSSVVNVTVRGAPKNAGADWVCPRLKGTGGGSRVIDGLILLRSLSKLFGAFGVFPSVSPLGLCTLKSYYNEHKESQNDWYLTCCLTSSMMFRTSIDTSG